MIGRALSTATLLLLSLPAMAQEPPANADLVAKALFGAADGASVFNEFALAVMRQAGPGDFIGVDESGTDVHRLLVTEPAPCRFRIEPFLEGAPLGAVNLDASQLEQVVYTTGVTLDDLPIPMTDYTIDIVGGAGVLLLDSVGADGQPQEAVRSDIYLMTSVPLAEIEDAVATLKQRCGGT